MRPLYIESCMLFVCIAASVSIPMEARQYMRQLVEQCMMQFFVAVKARESAQLFLKVYTQCAHACLLYYFPT